eukprot:5445703-Amphidinium_carterae.1
MAVPYDLPCVPYDVPKTPKPYSLRHKDPRPNDPPCLSDDAPHVCLMIYRCVLYVTKRRST